MDTLNNDDACLASATSPRREGALHQGAKLSVQYLAKARGGALVLAVHLS